MPFQNRAFPPIWCISDKTVVVKPEVALCNTYPGANVFSNSSRLIFVPLSFVQELPLLSLLAARLCTHHLLFPTTEQGAISLLPLSLPLLLKQPIWVGKAQEVTSALQSIVKSINAVIKPQQRCADERVKASLTTSVEVWGNLLSSMLSVKVVILRTLSALHVHLPREVRAESMLMLVDVK